MTGAAFGEFLEQESGYNLPEMTITANPCENPVYPDADSFEVFNTIGKPYDQYYEPVIEITDEETDAPGFLCRGGSFMGQSLSCLIQNHYFGKNVSMENRQIFTEEFGQVKEFSSYEEADMRECLRDIDPVSYTHLEAEDRFAPEGVLHSPPLLFWSAASNEQAPE